jgi:hypothetical protein
MAGEIVMERDYRQEALTHVRAKLDCFLANRSKYEFPDGRTVIDSVNKRATSLGFLRLNKEPIELERRSVSAHFTLTS